MSVDLARSNKIGNKLFHIPYRGPLYWPGINFSIYPISRDENQHHAGKNWGLTVNLVPENTYFIVMSPTGEMIDVVAELMGGDFIKCAKTTKIPPDINSDKDLRFGYLCGLEFFDSYHISRTAKLAKARRSHQGRLVYPQKYVDDSFQGFMYPLFPNGRFYGLGSGLQYAYSIHPLPLTVRTKKGIITPCEASTRGIEFTAPETDNFICGLNNEEFKNELLLELVKAACKVLGSVNRSYPAIYNGPEFDVHGPYVTWPIRYGDSITGRKNSVLTPSFYPYKAPTKFRVVMNNECMLAGVIAHLGKKTFYKCRRSKDYSIPGEESDMPITETTNKDRRK
ncbi:hypothetical protein EPUL_005271, partial [Erysiphe pulchra]